MKNCSVCNNDFILTYSGDVVSTVDDIHRQHIDCEKCDSIRKTLCEELLKTLQVGKAPLNGNKEDFVEYMNNKFNTKKNKWKK